METKAYTHIDRTALGWPPGPWDGEPDKVQWPDLATGLPCLAVRHPVSGHWCGYVGVAEGHPLFKCKETWEGPAGNLDVHGGITFTDMCQPGENEARGICHTPGPGEPDHVWWLGFDCAHSTDYSPSDIKCRQRLPGSQYRTLPYVKSQCRHLAMQLLMLKEKA